MILKQLKWENILSYKKGYFDFTTGITNISGLNGAGKSSIISILTEVLFNKNPKGILKTDLFNRNLGEAYYNIKLTFSLKDIDYELELTRKGNKSVLTLLKNNEDISFHTATQTYKYLEDLIGFDYTLFTQLTYQGATSSLLFLTGTDKQRKDFLVYLFSFEKYKEIYDKVSEVLKNIKNEITSITSKIEVLEGTLTRLETKKESIKILPLKEELEPFNDTMLIKLRNELDTIASYNKSVYNNLKIKSKLDALIIPEKVEEIDKEKQFSIITNIRLLEESLKLAQKEKVSIPELETEIKYLKREIPQLRTKANKKVLTHCPECNQPISHKEKLLVKEKAREEFNSLSNKLTLLETEYTEKLQYLKDIQRKNVDNIKQELNELKEKDLNYQFLEEKYKQYQAAISEQEKLTNRFNPSLLEEKNEDKLKEEYLILQSKKQEHEIEVKEIQNFNNTQIVAKDLLFEITSELDIQNNELELLTQELPNLEKNEKLLTILKESFSPKGIVALKIREYSRKLEELINTYLETMSDNFKIKFDLVKDKLSITILNRGYETSINSLSTGELSRVQISTVLACRKLLSINHPINLFILDDLIGILDESARDSLVEILSKEDICSVLISQDFDSKLVNTQLFVEKINGFSEIKEL